ncbi:unnamed protein product [Meganyctiphanes norvegica]|uniref:Uncharacterized protein n=1 Tax=Meganyctiphanes norvegica TaxID=48144 RepID=A0AAV2PPR9_MEGNR
MARAYEGSETPVYPQIEFETCQYATKSTVAKTSKFSVVDQGLKKNQLVEERNRVRKENARERAKEKRQENAAKKKLEKATQPTTKKPTDSRPITQYFQKSQRPR